MQNKIDFQTKEKITINNEKTLTLYQIYKDLHTLSEVIKGKARGILSNNEDICLNIGEIKCLVEKYLNKSSDSDIVFKRVLYKLKELNYFELKEDNHILEPIVMSMADLQKHKKDIIKELEILYPYVYKQFETIIKILKIPTNSIKRKIKTIKKQEYEKTDPNVNDKIYKLEKALDELKSVVNILEEYNKELINEIYSNHHFNIYRPFDDYDEQAIELESLLTKVTKEQRTIVEKLNQKLATIEEYLNKKEVNQSDCTNLLHKMSTDLLYSDYLKILTKLKQQIKKPAANINNDDYMSQNAYIEYKELSSIYSKDAKYFWMIINTQMRDLINYKDEHDKSMIYFYQSFNKLFEIKKQLEDSLKDFDPNKYPEFIKFASDIQNNKNILSNIKFASDIQNNKKILLNEVNKYIDIKIPLIKSFSKISNNQLYYHMFSNGNDDFDYFHEEMIESEKQKAQENIDSYVFEEYDLSGIDTSKVTLNIGVIEKMNEFIKDRLEEQFSESNVEKKAIKLENLLIKVTKEQRTIVEKLNQKLATLGEYLNAEKVFQGDYRDLFENISEDLLYSNYLKTLRKLKQQIEKLEANMNNDDSISQNEYIEYKELSSIYLKDAKYFWMIINTQIPNLINYKDEHDVGIIYFYQPNSIKAIYSFESFNKLFEIKKQLKDSLEDFDPNKYPEFIKSASDIQNNKKILLDEVNKYINIKIPLIKTLFKISNNQLSDHIFIDGKYGYAYFHGEDIEDEKKEAQENIDLYVSEEYNLSGIDTPNVTLNTEVIIDTPNVTLNTEVIKEISELIKDRLEQQLNKLNAKEQGQKDEVNNSLTAELLIEDQAEEEGQEGEVNNSQTGELLTEELLIEDRTNAQTIGDNHEIN